MTYRAPVKDMLFVLNELAGLPEVLEFPAWQEITQELVGSILQENASFAEQEIAPLNHKGDRLASTFKDGSVSTPAGFKRAFDGFVQGGWQGLHHDPQWGGQGLPKLLSAATSDTIHAANVAFALCPMLTDGVVEALTAVGSPQQQSLFIPRLLEGRWTGTMNLTEPHAGSDLALVSTLAVKQNDDSYRLSGEKIFITYGEHDLAENIIHLVLARAPDAPQGIKGLSLFIVPKFLVNEDGTLGPRNNVRCASIEHKLGIHASPTALMLYGSGKDQIDQGAVGYLIGEEGCGLEYMFIMMNSTRFAVGVQGVGLSERALQKAQAYAQERIQGQALGGSKKSVAITQHPDVQRMLLTMRALTEGARALAYVAAGACDRSQHASDDKTRADNKALYEYFVPIVKGFCTETSIEVASLGIQIHGGMGFIEETGAAQYYRDARILPIYEGTTAIQANDLLVRKTLRDDGAVARGLVAQMRNTLQALSAMASQPGGNQNALRVIVRRFEAAIKDYEQTLDYMLANAGDAPRAVFMGGVPYLMLAGTVLAGWQMARSALVSCRLLDSGSTDEFYSRKLVTALFYAAHILPRAQALGDAIAEGVVTSSYAHGMYETMDQT